MSNVPGAAWTCTVAGCLMYGRWASCLDELAAVLSTGAHFARHVHGEQLPRVTPAPSWRELVAAA